MAFHSYGFSSDRKSCIFSELLVTPLILTFHHPPSPFCCFVFVFKNLVTGSIWNILAFTNFMECFLFFEPIPFCFYLFPFLFFGFFLTHSKICRVNLRMSSQQNCLSLELSILHIDLCNRDHLINTRIY